MSFCAILNDDCPYDGLDCKKCDLGIAYVKTNCLVKAAKHSNFKIKIKCKNTNDFKELTYGEDIYSKSSDSRLGLTENKKYTILDIVSSRILIENNHGCLAWVEKDNFNVV